MPPPDLTGAIVLPWPPAILSPNARAHWGAKTRPRKHYRSAGFFAAIMAKVPRPLPFIGERLPIRVTFHPPDKRHRDADNMIASAKAGFDGMADGLGVNDRCFAPSFHFGPPHKGGFITVEVGQ